jgi:3-oxoacyl-[acyl-carrier protein] reductase
MDLGLHGKRAIVCGSSRGLGYACAAALAAEGVEVVLNGRDPARLEQARAELETRFGRPFAAVAADVTTAAGREALLAPCPDPDILVNNAAGPPPGAFESWGEQAWRAAVESNMLAPIHLTTQVIGTMRKQGFGRILNITSSAVKESLPLLGLSTAARLGLTGFVASIAREVAADGITLNNLLPGRFDTDRLAGYFGAVAKARGVSEDAARQVAIAEIPARRLGLPDEFGAVCAFLAGRWGGYITGQNILLDGGDHRGVL